jgi:methyl-accepting chemotaxis protein
MEVNKKTITTALETLDKLLVSDEGKTLLARIRDERKAYVASFTQVGKMLADGQRDAALAQLRSDMLPKLSPAGQRARIERDAEGRRHAERELVKHDISMARQMMAWLGVVALAIGLAFAWRVTRSITDPIGTALQMARASRRAT